MFSLDSSSLRASRQARLRRPFWLALLSLGLVLQVSAQTFGTASYALDADPSFSFGATPPDEFAMAAAIQARLGVAVSVVTSLPNENVGFAPVAADSEAAPFHVYGPSFGGVIKDLNLNSRVVTGITQGSLRFAGTELDFCGDTIERFILRVSTSTQFYDVLVRYTTCSGMANVVWSFAQISAPRPLLAVAATPSPTPKPVRLVSAASRKMHGPAGPFDVNLPLLGPPGIECRRTNNASGDYTIVYTFSETLNSVFDAMVISGIGRVQDSGIGPDPHQYIVNLVNVANAQTVTVRLDFVQDSQGHASSAVDASMSVLIGDVTANGKVAAADVKEVKAQLGHPVTMFNFRDDVNHDGFIDGTDLAIVQNHKGTFVSR
jgi:hypothetical protein